MTAITTHAEVGIQQSIKKIVAEVFQNKGCWIYFWIYDRWHVYRDPDFIPHLIPGGLGRLYINVYLPKDYAVDHVQTTLSGMQIYVAKDKKLFVNEPYLAWSIPRQVKPAQEITIQNERLDFSASDSAVVKYSCLEPATITYQTPFLGLDGRAIDAPIQVINGVFTLSRPGFGMLLVSYKTIRQEVCLTYVFHDVFPESDPGYAIIAREIVMKSGADNDRVLPDIGVLLRASQYVTGPCLDAETDEPLYDFISAPLKLDVNFMAFTMKKKDDENKDDKKKPDPFELEETCRKTETKRIYSTINPEDYVEVEVPYEMNFDSSDGQPWKMILQTE